MKYITGVLYSFFFLFLFTTCAYLETLPEQPGGTSRDGQPAAFNPPGQFSAGGNLLYSDLSPTGRPGAAPVLDLTSNETLTLFFETQGIMSGQYQLGFTHHNPDWSVSPLPSEFFMDGLNEIYLSGGELNQNDPFRYRQYIFTFPNRDVRFRRSGNYMLRITDSATGNLLFTLPFFVSENVGTARASIEKVLLPGSGRQILHRPFIHYTHPGFVEMPQFDLLVYFSQNRFWGRMKEARETDFSGNDESRFEMSSGEGFNGNFAAAAADIRTFSQLEPGIDNVMPAEVPVRIQLDEDVDNLYSDSGVDFTNYMSGAMRSTDARYADTEFRFEAEADLKEGESIYLTGDFNNWHIEEKLKLGEPDRLGLRSTTVRIKQGTYRYKYILFDGERFDLNPFENTFANQRQEYHSFVYFRDPETRSYRLLNVLNVRGPG